MTALAPLQAESPRGNNSTRPGGTPAPDRRTVRRSKAKRGLEPWLYLAPAFIVLIALLGYPIFQLINVSLYDYRQAQVSGRAPTRFIGAGELPELFADPQFWTVLGNTVLFAAACVVVDARRSAARWPCCSPGCGRGPARAVARRAGRVGHARGHRLHGLAVPLRPHLGLVNQTLVSSA